MEHRTNVRKVYVRVAPKPRGFSRIGLGRVAEGMAISATIRERSSSPSVYTPIETAAEYA